MRARAVVGSLVASAAVLIVGWQAGGTATQTSTATAVPQPATGAASSSATTDTAAAAPSADGPADGTYTGSVVDTRFGSVQVSVTLAGGAITDVTALQLTDADGRSVQISNRAAPILHDEVVASQSTAVTMVSGATYTSRAYLTSVQSALDQAGF